MWFYLKTMWISWDTYYEFDKNVRFEAQNRNVKKPARINTWDKIVLYEPLCTNAKSKRELLFTKVDNATKFCYSDLQTLWSNHLRELG